MFTGVLVLLGTALWVGCDGGSGDSDGGATDGNTDSNGGGGGGGGGGNTDGDCPVPAGATIHLNYTDLRLDPSDATDGSLVRTIVVEDNGIFVATLDQVVKLGPSPSDAPTAVMQTTTDQVLGIVVVDTDDGFRVGDDSGWRDQSGVSVAYPDGAQPIDGINAAAAWVMAPNGDIYERYDDRDDNFDPEAVHYVRRVPGAGAQEVLATNLNPEYGWGRALFFGAGAVWSTTVAERFGEPNRIEQAVRIGTDGSTRVDSYDPSGAPFLVTENYIYYNRESDVAQFSELGVWRAATGGGAGEKVGGTFGGWEGVASGNRVVLRDPATILVLDDQPGATAVTLAELPVRSTIGSSCTSHALAVRNGKVYSSMFDEAREMSLIFSYDLP
jgi:hypothetical protein